MHNGMKSLKFTRSRGRRFAERASLMNVGTVSSLVGVVTDRYLDLVDDWMMLSHVVQRANC